jgi:hypothetical protein
VPCREAGHTGWYAAVDPLKPMIVICYPCRYFSELSQYMFVRRRDLDAGGESAREL